MWSRARTDCTGGTPHAAFPALAGIVSPMKRGMSGKTRRGPPPLARQRKALRVLQLTLAAVSVALGLLAFRAWEHYRSPDPKAAELGRSAEVGLAEVAVLASGTVLFAGWALSIGLKVPRGPELPSLAE